MAAKKAFLTPQVAYDDDDVHPALFTRLRELVNDMYEARARQFIFINAPPLERSPRVLGLSASATRIPAMAAAVADYNKRMLRLAKAVNHDRCLHNSIPFRCQHLDGHCH
ncbi:hypothetical protein V498_04602 [Pseudogymnoascus sp. VKM F-4517 (FW-2822)]|nr:hypothetical protein V498_04602 [Pseudogymnoascus sp. VKM F-4517 (FW-2822)]